MTIPMVALSVMSGMGMKFDDFDRIDMLITVFDSLLYLYLILSFKRLVNYRFEYHKADRYIYLLIGISVVMTVISLVMPRDSEGLDPITIGYFVLLIPFGIVSILFGSSLLKIEFDFSYLRLFSWSTIITGALLASVVLFILALPVGLLSTFAMAMMFFTASRELRRAEEKSEL
jgi:hypothetical protein